MVGRNRAQSPMGIAQSPMVGANWPIPHGQCASGNAFWASGNAFWAIMGAKRVFNDTFRLSFIGVSYDVSIAAAAKKKSTNFYILYNGVLFIIYILYIIHTYTHTHKYMNYTFLFRLA